MLQLIGSALGTLIDFVEILLLFRFVQSLGGWSFPEVMFLYGLAATAFSIAEALAAGFDRFHLHIVDGVFDRVLVRPIDSLFQIFASDIGIRRVARIAQSFAIVGIAMSMLSVDMRFDRIALLAISIVSGVAIFFAFFILGAAFNFWTVQANEVVNIFTHGGSLVASYPLDIYAVWLRRLVAFIIPLGFINYFPALYILGRPETAEYPIFLRFMSPFVAIVVNMLALHLWSRGVRQYQSTGS